MLTLRQRKLDNIFALFNIEDIEFHMFKKA